MRYHVVKSTRPYQGVPYAGCSSKLIPMESDNLEYAINLAKTLQEKNPVGWNVVDHITGNVEFGQDHFATESQSFDFEYNEER